MGVVYDAHRVGSGNVPAVPAAVGYVLASPVVTGIDVSAYVPDWEAWKVHRGISFGLVKASEGLTYDEPSFDANWEGMRKTGLRRFAYHYAHPAESPSAQAAFFTRIVKTAGLEKGDNYVLDLETSDGLSPVDVSFWGYVFCREMNAMNPGHRIIPYTYPGFANAGYCAKLFSWALWIADYGVPHPEVPQPWAGHHDSWTLWQSSAGGNVDYDEYAGSDSQFLAWTASSG